MTGYQWHISVKPPPLKLCDAFFRAKEVVHLFHAGKVRKVINGVVEAIAYAVHSGRAGEKALGELLDLLIEQPAIDPDTHIAVRC